MKIGTTVKVTNIKGTVAGHGFKMGEELTVIEPEHNFSKVDGLIHCQADDGLKQYIHSNDVESVKN